MLFQDMKKGFTLVELIVVITIVGILSTVGFVSYSGYLTGARDSNRISQLTKLSDSLQVYAASKSLPLPDDKIDITASGTTIAYQGYVGVDVLETIDYTNGGKDPKDDGYYTYYLTKDRKSMQLLALMEEPQTVAYEGINPSIANTYAATYEDRYPKVYGRKLGVLTQPTTNTPAQEVTVNITNGSLDIVNTTDQYISHITDEEKLEGTGTALQASIPNGSCNRIKQTGGAKGSGIYEINPAGAGVMRVYCDMETAGGGWTLIARTVPGATGNFGWYVSRGDARDDSQPYSMGARFLSIKFSGLLAAGYSSSKQIDDFIFKYDVDSDVLLGLGTGTQNFQCETIKDFFKNTTDPTNTGSYNISTDCTQMANLGNAVSSKIDGYHTGGRTSGPAGFNVGTQFWININGQQGMIFVK